MTPYPVHNMETKKEEVVEYTPRFQADGNLLFWIVVVGVPALVMGILIGRYVL